MKPRLMNHWHNEQCKQMTSDSLQDQFISIFGAGYPPEMAVAPGRVNLIGEHTDYNQGLVCPMAIEPCIHILFRGRADSRVIVESNHFASRVEFDLSQPIQPAAPGHWSNYVRGIARQLIDAGHPLKGVEALLSSTLPVGAGLSSSAAVEVGMGIVLAHVARLQITPTDMASLALGAERDFAGVNCGIMDQTIIAAGQGDHAMLLDCRSLEKKFVPLRWDDLRVVIVNSMQGHALAEVGDRLDSPDGKTHRGSPYNMRRLACEIGVEAIRARHPDVRALRDATLPMLDEALPQLTQLIHRRCRHVITEIARCANFARCMSRSDYEEAGRLMYASHDSLRDDYSVSTPALDKLVDIARGVPGVFGSRLTGAGFGGCTVSLVKPDAVDALIDTIRNQFRPPTPTDTQIIVTRATQAARISSSPRAFPPSRTLLNGKESTL